MPEAVAKENARKIEKGGIIGLWMSVLTKTCGRESG